MDHVTAADDGNGLVWGYRFGGSGEAVPLDGDAALAALASRTSWVWLHFDLGDTRAKAFLSRLGDLPPEAMDVLLGADDRPRLDSFAAAHGSVIAGVAMDFERDDTPDPRRMVAWRFCMLPHAFISARRQPLLTMQEMHFNLMSGRRYDSVLHLFDAIIHSYITALSRVSASLAEQLDTVEDGMLEGDDVGDYEALGSVRRNATRLFRQTLPLNGMIGHMLGERPEWFTDEAAEDCKHVSLRIASVAADLTALQERARALVDEVASRQAEQTNQRLMLLSVISAVMLPPTVIGGIFGMNVGGLPWLENKAGFLYAMALMAASIAALMFVLRRLRLV